MVKMAPSFICSRALLQNRENNNAEARKTGNPVYPSLINEPYNICRRGEPQILGSPLNHVTFHHAKAGARRQSTDASGRVCAVEGGKRVDRGASPEPVHKLMEPMTGERRREGHIMEPARSLCYEYAAGLEDARDFRENRLGPGEMFEHIVRKDQIERGRRVRELLTASYAGFMQEGVLSDALVGIESANAASFIEKVHLGNDAGAGAEIKNNVFRPHKLQNLGSEQQVIPPVRIRAVPISVHPTS